MSWVVSRVPPRLWTCQHQLWLWRREKQPEQECKVDVSLTQKRKPNISDISIIKTSSSLYDRSAAVKILCYQNLCCLKSLALGLLKRTLDRLILHGQSWGPWILAVDLVTCTLLSSKPSQTHVYGWWVSSCSHPIVSSRDHAFSRVKQALYGTMFFNPFLGFKKQKSLLDFERIQQNLRTFETGSKMSSTIGLCKVRCFATCLLTISQICYTASCYQERSSKHVVPAVRCAIVTALFMWLWCLKMLDVKYTCGFANSTDASIDHLS